MIPLPLIPLIPGAIGALVGFCIYKKGEQNGFKEGYEKGKAEHAVEVENFKKQFEDIYEEVHAYRISEDCYRAYFAMAIAFVNCDELITRETEELIQSIITGACYKAIPAPTRVSVEPIFSYGKTKGIVFEEAIGFVKKIDLDAWDELDVIIETLLSVTKKSKAKIVFVDQWQSFKRHNYVRGDIA